MTSERSWEEKVRMAVHGARRLQLVCLIAMAGDLAFGFGFALLADVGAGYYVTLTLIFLFGLLAFISAVLVEARLMRTLRDTR